MANCEKGKSSFKVTDNDVSAVGQMRNSNKVYFLGNPEAKRRLLIVGNSITRHGPLAEIGWEKDWGMAASCPERDYVHVLCSRLLEMEDVFVMVRQFAEWERDYLLEGVPACYVEEQAFGADEIIYRLGENVKPLQSDEEEAVFAEALDAFIRQINPKGGKVYFTTCFWRNTRVDGAIRTVAERMQMPLVDIGPLGDYDENMAIGLFEHQGVAHHPGDLGMQRIADMLYAEMRG